MNVGQVLQYLPLSPAGDSLRSWAAAAAWVARTLKSRSIASVSKLKQNIAFGLTLNANHVLTAERDAIRGHYIKGWAEANDSIVARARKRWRIFRKGHYKQTPMADINESFKAQKMLTSKDWKRMYSGGTVTN